MSPFFMNSSYADRISRSVSRIASDSLITALMCCLRSKCLLSFCSRCSISIPPSVAPEAGEPCPVNLVIERGELRRHIRKHQNGFPHLRAQLPVLQCNVKPVFLRKLLYRDPPQIFFLQRAVPQAEKACGLYIGGRIRPSAPPKQNHPPSTGRKSHISLPPRQNRPPFRKNPLPKPHRSYDFPMLRTSLSCPPAAAFNQIPHRAERKLLFSPFQKIR